MPHADVFNYSRVRLWVAVAVSISSIWQWSIVEGWLEFQERMRAEYSPELLAAAHVNLAMPAGMLVAAILGTLYAAVLWWLVWLAAEK